MKYNQLADTYNIAGSDANINQFAQHIILETIKRCAAEGEILSEIYNKPEYKSFSAKGAVYNYVNIIRNLPYNDKII